MADVLLSLIKPVADVASLIMGGRANMGYNDGAVALRNRYGGEQEWRLERESDKKWYADRIRERDNDLVEMRKSYDRTIDTFKDVMHKASDAFNNSLDTLDKCNVRQHETIKAMENINYRQQETNRLQFSIIVVVIAILVFIIFYKL